MSGHLIVLAGDHSDAPAAWAWWDDGAAGPRDSGEVAALSGLGLLAGRAPARVSLLIPGDQVLALRAPLPARTDAQARAAAPYAIEDYLATPLDRVHVALGTRQTDGTRLILAIAADLLTGWRAALQAVNLAPDLIMPDYLALPARAGEMHVAMLGQRLACRLPDGTGFAADSDLAAMLLPDLTATQVPQRVVHAGALAVDVAAALPADAALIDAGADGAAALLSAVGQRPSDGVNLLQGRFTAGPGWRAVLRPWRWAAALAAAWLLAMLVLALAQGWRDHGAAADRVAAAEALFRQQFPEVRTLVNPRAQLQARLRRLGGGGEADFITLAALLTTALAEVEQVSLDGLRFDQERGGLAASLRYQAFSDVELVRAAVARQGGVAEEGGARQSGGEIIGEIMVRGR